MAALNHYLFFREQIARGALDWCFFAWAALGRVLQAVWAPGDGRLRGLVRAYARIARHALGRAGDGDLPRLEWLPYHLPSIGEEEIAEVVDTMRSGWITTGAKTQRFERDFAELLDIPEALALASGTAALHLGLVVCGVQAGDEVVVPTYTFTATSRTRAVMPVHIAGQSCDMDPLLALARAHDIKVIEDAAHAFPARYRGRWVGTLGDAGAFSFYATKNITTGEGGMLTVADSRAAERARILALHGISRDAWKRYTAAGTWYYEVLANGHKYNLSDLQSSIGIHQLRKLDRFHEIRSRHVARYRAGLEPLEALELPQESPDTDHAWHLFLVRLRPGVLAIDRNAFIEELRARNIGTSVHFIPLHLHPFYRREYGYRAGDFPAAESAYERTISLPLYPGMSEADVDDVIEAVGDVVKRTRR
jgi:dTDP-4-amino-4,6-dideoxygalactose transaminase